MNLIRLSIERPVAIIAAVLMVILFGLVALQAIPIQLAPDVNRPVITVTTSWPGAAPAEVEREILNRQEEVMAGLEGLQSITGRAEPGRARVTLEFDVSTNMDRALLLVSNRLDRVNGYPDEANEPTLDTAGSEDSPIRITIKTAAIIATGRSIERRMRFTTIPKTRQSVRPDDRGRSCAESPGSRGTWITSGNRRLDS